MGLGVGVEGIGAKALVLLLLGGGKSVGIDPLAAGLQGAKNLCIKQRLICLGKVVQRGG